MPVVGSGYTFADFLCRLERSPDSYMAPLYHEHSTLFVRRPDMFVRAISGVTWAKGAALVAAATYTQPVSVVVYRALLARMLLHNRHVQRCGTGSFVPWAAAMRVYHEAIATHGNAVPTRMTLSALRLCEPARKWEAAMSLLMLSQANEKLTLPMLVDAASCCATPATWMTAMDLLGRFHAQSPNVLPESIQSLRPIGTSASTVDAAAHALLPSSEVPTGEQRHVLQVLNRVVSCVPWDVALSNLMCHSYLTHLVASTTISSWEKTNMLTSAVQQLPWGSFMKLMATVSDALLEGEQTAAGATAALETNDPCGESVEERSSYASLLSSTFIRDGVQLLKSRPEVAIAFITTILHKLPTAEAAVLFVNEAVSLYRGSSCPAAAASVRHPVVVNALLKKCVENNSWHLALSVLKTASPVAIPCEVGSALLLQMREANQVSLVVDVLQKHIVPTRSKLSREAVEAALFSVLKHNCAVAGFCASPTPTRDPADTQVENSSGAMATAGVHWLSALSWAVDLLEDGVEARILQAGTAPSSGAVSQREPTVLPRVKTLSSRALSLLIHICVSAGSARGGLLAMGYARTADKTELDLSEEIRALLYCMMYNRPVEAESIVQHAVKKYGEGRSRHLQRLWKAVQGANRSPSWQRN